METLSKSDFLTMLENNLDLQEFLFIRGFLLTDRKDIAKSEFPFYGKWNVTKIGKWNVFTHPLTGFHFAEMGGVTAVMFGHAYNPFSMETDETVILQALLAQPDQDSFYEYLSELTGVYDIALISENDVCYLTDVSGMQHSCSGIVGEHFYLSSHAQLVADLCELEMAPFVRELVNYKWYKRVHGEYLPGDLMPYSELCRVVPNQEYSYSSVSQKISNKRFYPVRELTEYADEEEYRKIVSEAADILRRNMELVIRKWNEPWISLTGGLDSTTCFAATNGNYDKVKSFSYLSEEKEKIDCDAAEKIAGVFNVPWVRYDIPENPAQLDRYDEKIQIIFHNNAYIAQRKGNELRKRVFLQSNCPAPVEVKSWVSEMARADWYKHFHRKRMPKLSAKLYRNLYKIFITNRSLAHKVDKVFEDYLNKYGYYDIPKTYYPAEIYHDEVSYGSWGGLNINEMKFCFDITVIFNNRKYMDLLFRTKLSDRIADRPHKDMKAILNRELSDMNLNVVNANETKSRARALNAIFTINSFLPF